MLPYNQLPLADIFSDCQDIYESGKPQFLPLLQNYLNLDVLVPASFRKRFYASTGRTRKYPLYAFLWALIIQKIFSIPTDSLLLVFLHYPRHLRGFCGFDKVPGASKITRFKQDFLDDPNDFFHRLVDMAEPICQQIDSVKASMAIFDPSGIEAWVTGNSPKYAGRIIRQLKAYAKSMHSDESYGPYKAAYASMPSCASANPEIKQLYIDGHFCYAYKFGIATNGLGIIRRIDFYNKDFSSQHPGIILNRKSGPPPDEDKSVHDARPLIPTLQGFFLAHPPFHPKTFLGDAAFDSVKLYRELLPGDTFGANPDGSGIHFQKAYIPLNARAHLENMDYTINADGTPCCPSDSGLPMKHEGTAKLKSGATRYKFVCPKMRWVRDPVTLKYRRKCFCENPCAPSSCGRMACLYPEKNLRAYPGTLRGAPDWNDAYKARTTVERSINHVKDSFCLQGRKTQNEKTLHAGLPLAGISQLLGVILADRLHQRQYIRSLKPLVA